MDAAYQALNTADQSLDLSLDVINAARGDEYLATRLATFEAFQDMKSGNLLKVSPELQEERKARGHYSVEQLDENWSAISEQLRRNYIVSIVSALEHFAKSLAVEFPSPIFQLDRQSFNQSPMGMRIDRFDVTSAEFEKVDKTFRKQMKKNKTAASKWAEFFHLMAIPENVKGELRSWGVNYHDEFGEMILVRNAIVHRAGTVGKELAAILECQSHTEISITNERLSRYRLSMRELLCLLYPAL